MSMNFNAKDLRANHSQERDIDADQAPSQLLLVLSFTSKFKPTFLGHDSHGSTISLGFDLASHQPIDIQLGRSMFYWES